MVRLPDFRWLADFRRRRAAASHLRAHLGPHSHIDASVQILGCKQVRIGHHTIVSEGSWINVNHRDTDEPAIIIGDNCFLGRRNFLSAGASIKIGDYCLTGVDCHFLGSDHIAASPFAPYVSTGTTADGVIEVGPNCWFGASVTVLKNVKVGFGSIIGAATVLNRDVPPCSVVVGNPGRVVKRFDARRSGWVRAEEYPAESDAYLPLEADYLALLRKTHPAVKGPIIASGCAMGDL